MRRGYVAALVVGTGLCVALAALRPALLIPLAIGGALGVVADLILVALRRRASRDIRAKRAASRTKVIVVTAALAGVLGGGASAILSTRGGDRGGLGVNPPPAVIGVYYRAELTFDASRNVWRRREFVRLPSALIKSKSAKRPRTSMLRELFPGWRYDGTRGATRDTVAYVHRDSVPLKTRSWPLLTDNTISLTKIRSRRLPFLWAPRDGSTVVFRAPERLIYDTDPPGTRVTYDNNDTLTLTLSGLEDDPEDDLEVEAVHLQVANGVGRHSIGAHLLTVSGWAVSKWVALLVAAGVSNFFLAGLLKQRFPESPSDRRATVTT